MVKIFDKGKPIYNSPSVMSIREYCKIETKKLWPEVLRLQNPHAYYVDLSKKLWELKESLLYEYSSKYHE